MGWRPLAVAAASLAAAIAAEAATYLPEEPELAAGDALVGLAFLGLGMVAWQRRPSSRSGLLMVATGFAWFAGSFASAALFLHRGPLVHLLVGYPQGRLRWRLEQVIVAAAYVDGAVYPLARQDGVTVALSLVVAVTALVGYLRAGGPERRRWWPPRPSLSSWALAPSPALWRLAPTRLGCGSIRLCWCWWLSGCSRICCGGAGPRPPSPAWWSTSASPSRRERSRSSSPGPSGIPR